MNLMMDDNTQKVIEHFFFLVMFCVFCFYMWKMTKDD